jgi:3-hydroxybutyryl-CoA dehydrogenase|tara:strand:- start:3090 stop:3950 length:861 start_codon:yes stop_codon:yes gene_type:complete
MIRKLGIVGAGVMGRGVAQAAAQCGMDVVLVDIEESVLSGAVAAIHQAVRFSSMMGGGKLNDSVETICDRIKTTVDLEALSDVDFLVENVTEKTAVKQELYPRLDAACNAECVFAVNTSAISITKVASWTERAELVVGMHFMNPVPMKPVVEVIRAFHTSEETLNKSRDFLSQLNKEAIIVNDMPGFVSNRVLMLTVNEAILLVQDNVSSPKDIDKIFKGCFGHKMGPLETADLIGIDTILYSLDVLYESYKDSKFRPAPLLQKMVAAGLHGRKSGEGFYKYPNLL